MNIQRAKQEIINTVRAYLDKDEQGFYRIPQIRQRPILLMGPPGIGKTQVMEQIARECDLALVAYTITHHTRQSAIGLPFIVQKSYGGVETSVTEYTMSEIIASVYDRMEASGKREGILFIDEINCVSEPLAPAMLQFLQGKTFGNRKVPDGWIIVAAGNPAEYNRSVREFDVVTLDRLRVMEVVPDYGVWRTYATDEMIHGSILSYLDIHKENFYRMETTVDGREFVTARGWQDLSEYIIVCEALGLGVDREVISQYVAHPGVAKDFANYLELYYKYKADYHVEEILSGNIRKGTLGKLKFATMDERLKVTGLLLSALTGTFREVYEEDELTGLLFGYLEEVQEAAEKTVQDSGAEPTSAEDGDLHDGKAQSMNRVAEACEQILSRERTRLENRIAAGQGERQLVRRDGAALDLFETYAALAREQGDFEALKVRFGERRDHLEAAIAAAAGSLEHVFDFMEAAFPESREVPYESGAVKRFAGQADLRSGVEMTVFITELSMNRYASWMLGEYDCDRYYMYNKNLLFDEREQGIRQELDRIRELQVAPGDGSSV